MNLKIGILGKRDGWLTLLQQIGIPYAVVKDSLLPEEYSVTVVSDDVDDRESEMLRQYLTLGGAVLCSTKVYARIRQTTAQLMNIDYLYATQGSLFHSLGIIDIFAPCQIAWNANDLKTNKGVYAAHIGTYTEDFVIALPFDPATLVLDRRVSIKSFYSPLRRLPFETVTLVSKGEIRMLVSQCLEILHHRRGLPYVHLWHFPNGARSVFCFRIDTDQGSVEQMRELSRTVHRNEISATWFIDTKSHDEFMKHYVEMYKQEIGIHCFEHETFSDYDRNIQNIRRAKSVLRNARLNAKGYAAPFGAWNDELGRAIVDSGFEYSSEFSYDYDNLPGVPQFRKDEGALQIPIHPICIGNLKRQSYSDKSMIRYFAGVIQRKLLLREPIIFYHHPRDEHYEVLNWLFREMQRERIPGKTMGEFARWWKMRIAASVKFRYTKGNVNIQGVPTDRSLYLRIVQPNGTEAVIPISKQIVLETVRWKPKQMPWRMPDDYLRSRRFNYRIPLVRGLDAVTKIIRRKRM